MLVDDAVMVVHHEFRPDEAVQILEVGATVPWHACALGHAIVAFLPEADLGERLDRPLRPLTGRTRTAPEALRKALGTVRDKGFAVENQEANVGDAGLAAPVFDHSGHAVGSIGVVGPAERLLTRTARAQLSRAVVETARAVSRDLGAARGSQGRPPRASCSPVITTPTRRRADGVGVGGVGAQQRRPRQSVGVDSPATWRAD